LIDNVSTQHSDLIVWGQNIQEEFFVGVLTLEDGTITISKCH